ncbi:MAG: prolipoprotein diacylglyceryl transferase family protein [Gemmatimonadaceae bacterium]
MTTPVRPAASVAGRLAYAALFVVVLPALLVLWARRLDSLVALPALGSPAVGIAVAALGLALMLAGTMVLWQRGHGLPMSAYPPERLVTGGIYRYVADPLYVGAVALCAGASLAARSPAGLWIVTPVLALSITSWLFGFERDFTRQRFGALAVPLLRLPPAAEARPTGWQRLSVYGLVLIPWLVLYEAVELLGAPAGAWSASVALDARIPVIPWTEALYCAVYPFVVLAPLAAARQRDLRRFAVRGLWATGLVITFYLLVPVVAVAKTVHGDGFWQLMLLLERWGDAPATAFPAFHVVWACIAASMYAATWPSLRWLAWTLLAATGASCVTTGMHAILDVAGGLAAYAAIANGGAIWEWVRRRSERLANSWWEVTAGPVRLQSHGLFIGLALLASMPVAIWLSGPDYGWWVFGVAASAGLVSALWAQGVEGSPQLLRPFGYFGGIIGVVLAVVIGIVAGIDAWRLMAGFCVAFAFGQALGRLRCTVNGCCHGHEAPAAYGVRYTHPRTRVTRLSTLGGVPIHPTQVYSLGWMLVVGCILLRLWMLEAPLPFITGFYFILVGLGRFIEEHLRGEPQTAVYAGLRLYQWLAIAFIVGGAALTAIPGAPAPAPTPIGWSALAISALAGILGIAAMGVDFPQSNRRFSRLS